MSIKNNLDNVHPHVIKTTSSESHHPFIFSIYYFFYAIIDDKFIFLRYYRWQIHFFYAIIEDKFDYPDH